MWFAVYGLPSMINEVSPAILGLQPFIHRTPSKPFRPHPEIGRHQAANSILHEIRSPLHMEMGTTDERGRSWIKEMQPPMDADERGWND